MANDYRILDERDIKNFQAGNKLNVTEIGNKVTYEHIGEPPNKLPSKEQVLEYGKPFDITVPSVYDSTGHVKSETTYFFKMPDKVDTSSGLTTLKQKHNTDILNLQNQIDNIVIEASESGDVAAEVVQARGDLFGINHDTLKDRIDNVERIRESLSNTNSVIFGEENPSAALEGENPMVIKSAIYQDDELVEDERRLMIRYTIDGVRRYKLTNKNYLFRVIGYRDKVNNIYESYNKDNILGKGEYTNEYVNTWDNCIIIFKRVDDAFINSNDIANLYDSFSWAKPIVNDVSEEIEENKEKISKVTSILFGEEKPSTALTGENLSTINATIYQDGSIVEDNRRLMVRYTINGVRRYKLTNKNYLFRIIGYKDKVDNIYENYNKDNILGKGEYTNEYINTWDNCIIIFKRVDEGNITDEDIANLYDSFRWAKPVVSDEIEKAKMTDLSGYAVNVTRDGTNLMYVSKSETPNIRITAIELKKDVFINVKCKNINRCRVGVKNSKMSTAIDNLINLSDRTYVDDVIINNDALTAYEFAYYNTAENATVFLYLTHGEEGVNPEITIDYDIKKYIDYDQYYDEGSNEIIDVGDDNYPYIEIEKIPNVFNIASFMRKLEKEAEEKDNYDDFIIEDYEKMIEEIKETKALKTIQENKETEIVDYDLKVLFSIDKDYNNITELNNS